MRISFAFTTKKAKDLGLSDPLITGQKTQSRRIWKDSYAQMFINHYNQGKIIHEAWDGSVRNNPNAQRLGYIRLCCAPYKQRIGDIDQAQLWAEGGFWTREEFISLFGDESTLVWVIIWDSFTID